MKARITKNSDTNILIDFSAEEEKIEQVRAITLKRLGKTAKIKGFREGTAPVEMVEKNIDRELFINEFLDDIMSRLYAEAISLNKLRPVTKPKAEIKKFVPFTQLEFNVVTEIIPEIKLPDYSKIKIKKSRTEVNQKQIKEVIENLRTKLASKKEENRPAKKDDEVWIDFDGKDSLGKPINGASGKDYPIVLGSNTFIPGFEENVVGLKTGDTKTFEITFPKTYQVKALSGKKAVFEIKVNKINSIQKPKVDNEFAKQSGNFKSVKELESDIEKQLVSEQELEANRKLQNDIIQTIVDQCKFDVPLSILDSFAIEILNDFQRNLSYRGMTYQQYLESVGMDEETHKKKEIDPVALKRAKGSLVLAEIAEKEKIFVTPEELEVRLTILRGQFNDDQMQKQLETDEAKREVSAQILNDKTITRLVEICTT